MTKYKEIEILDIEESDDGTKFEVPFEVPGDKFGQSYPKRLKHTFPKKERFFEEVDDKGTRRFEKIMKEIYVEKDKDREERQKVDSKLEDVRKDCAGKCLGRSN